MARLSLCIIARDEAQLLPDCLASVQGVVDEIILVDTGSADATPAIARQAGAHVHFLAWADDFSAPRNEALRHATGDWVLQLDADERLAPGAGRALRSALEGADFDCGMLRLHDASRLDATAAEVLSGKARLTAPVQLPRLLRRTDRLAYQGIVHENVDAWLVRRGLKVQPLDVDILHLGAVPALREARNKATRNIELLRRRCASETEDVTPFGFLALELLTHGDRTQAREVAERGWALADRQPAHRSLLRLAVARATLQLDEGAAAGALATVVRAEQQGGPYPDLFFLRGCCLELLARAAPTGSVRQEREAHAGLAAFGQARAGAGAPGEGEFIEGGRSWACHEHEGELWLTLGDPTLATRSFTAALAEKPDSFLARTGQAECCLETDEPASTLRHVESLLDERPDGWLLAAAAAEMTGALADARALFAAARARSERGYATRRRLHRHLQLALALAAYEGAPTAGPGPFGLLGALLARAPALPDGPGPSDAALARWTRNLLRANQTSGLETLLEPRAEAAVPGIGARVRRILESLGAEIQDDGLPDVVLLAGDPAQTAWLAQVLASHPGVTVQDTAPQGSTGMRFLWRCGNTPAQLRDAQAQFPAAKLLSCAAPDGPPQDNRLTLSQDELLDDPVRVLGQVLAFLGQPWNEEPLRRLIETYPRRGRLPTPSRTRSTA